jgi:CDP-4-dehydro-6-deoxyglucose reductase, E3
MAGLAVPGMLRYARDGLFPPHLVSSRPYRMTCKVTLSRSGRQFDVRDGESILAAGLREGLALPFGCQSGGCGSCRVQLLSGHVDYPEPYTGGPPALSDAEITAGYILMCLARPQGDVDLLLHQPEMLEELRPRTLPARIIQKTLLSHDVIGLTVKLPRGETFRYLPGQYVDFLIEDGKRRSFSIANVPGTPPDTLEFHMRIAPGGEFAERVRDELEPGALLRFEGPLGAFYLREDSGRTAILVAGGTGFAPLRAMLESHLANDRARRFHLFWGVRARRDLYLDALPRQWAGQFPNFSYTPVLSDPDAGWDGEHGFVHESVLRHYHRLDGHEAYLAGPPAMVHKGKDAFVRAGLDADHLFYDSFDYAYETWPGVG